MSEDSIEISNLTMRILFESGLYSNADTIQDFTVYGNEEEFFMSNLVSFSFTDTVILPCENTDSANCHLRRLGFST